MTLKYDPIMGILRRVVDTIKAGGTIVETADADAKASEILSGKTAYVAGEKVTGTITSISAQTYTPGTTNITIAGGKYLAGNQVIKGDGNLTSANIKKGVSIFGVEGTVEAGIDTSDATAGEFDILNGKTAYVNGQKIEGVIPTKSLKDEAAISNTSLTINAGYYSAGGVDLTTLQSGCLCPENIAKDKVIFGVSGTYEGKAGITIYDRNYGYKTVTELPTYDGDRDCFASGVNFITFETAGKYCSDDITVFIGTDLKAENVRCGKTIGDVYGLFTADADATAADIAEGKIAYVQGEKVVGTMQAGSSGSQAEIEDFVLQVSFDGGDTYTFYRMDRGSGRLWRANYPDSDSALGSIVLCRSGSRWMMEGVYGSSLEYWDTDDSSTFTNPYDSTNWYNTATDARMTTTWTRYTSSEWAAHVAAGGE